MACKKLFPFPLWSSHCDTPVTVWMDAATIASTCNNWLVVVGVDALANRMPGLKASGCAVAVKQKRDNMTANSLNVR